MSKYLIPFSKPYFSDRDIIETKSRIEQILRSGWLTSGPFVQQFEKAFAEYIGTKQAVSLNSCTAALHTTLLALGVKSGDEVIVPSNTFVATANAVLYAGAKPVFADSDPETFNISPIKIREKISKKTKMILVVHLAGNPCDMKEIAEIAADHKLVLVEDCAHAHGAKHKAASCGTIGVAGCFSFYPTKIMTTAEGGLVTTNNEAIARKINIMRNHGRATYGPSKIVDIGFNYRLSEVHAAIGLTQIEHVSEFVTQRNELARIYNRELTKVGWLIPQRVEIGNRCSYYTYIVKLANEAPLSRDVLMKNLEEKSIGTSILYRPIHLQPFYAKLFGSNKGELPVAEELGKKSLALPLYNGMKVEEIMKVTESIKDILNET